MEESHEIPAKRAKLDLNLDPLDFLHSDVFELIFQHFTWTDVIETSLISKNWFEATAKSTKCVEKLHLKIVVPYKKEEAVKFHSISKDLFSERKYQNIYLHNFQDIVPEILKLMAGRRWKKVFISVRNLKSPKDFLDIMKLVEPTVENLSISRTSIETSDDTEDVKFSFPALKNLELHRSFSILMKEISRDCKSLKQLKIDTDLNSWRSNEVYLRQILKNNKLLEKLTLWRCSAIHAFDPESIRSYQFKLKIFIYQNSCDQFGAATAEEENCLLDFLSSQVSQNFLLNFFFFTSFRFRLTHWKHCGSKNGLA